MRNTSDPEQREHIYLRKLNLPPIVHFWPIRYIMCVIQDRGKRCMRFYSSTDVELNTWRTGRSRITCTEVA
jgi:hypothetical protein